MNTSYCILLLVCSAKYFINQQSFSWEMQDNGQSCFIYDTFTKTNTQAQNMDINFI
jgi:hypothetical protein